MLFITARMRRSEVFLRQARLIDVSDGMLYRRFKIQQAKRVLTWRRNGEQ